jgi:protein-S-isoprenylcysteine O-methyltransferase Ste14
MTRPYVLLFLIAIYLAVAFGWRTWSQVRRTGSTGFRGISGAPGSAAWFGGVLFIVALAGTVAAPLLAAAGVDEPRGAWDVPAAIALAGGVTLLVWAQHAMGASWRIGVDAHERTTLITHGPFAWMRNPIFTGLIASSAGLVLALPTITSIASTALLIVAIELQVRAVEEPYLKRVHGDLYRTYAARVGRFVPWF